MLVTPFEERGTPETKKLTVETHVVFRPEILCETGRHDLAADGGGRTKVLLAALAPRR